MKICGINNMPKSVSFGIVASETKKELEENYGFTKADIEKLPWAYSETSHLRYNPKDGFWVQSRHPAEKITIEYIKGFLNI